MTPPPTDNWQEFREGALDIAPVVLACLPIGMLFGTLAAAKGISPLEAGLMSALVFGGASQFVAVDMWREPVPWAMLALTVFIVNIRHILMGVSLARHLKLFAPATRSLAAFVMTDEIWAFAERRALRRPLTPAYYWGMGVALYVQWPLGTVIGAALGRTLGDPAVYGLDFAFAALFICIAMGFWRGPRTAAVLAVSAIVAAVTSTLVPGAWYIAAGGLAGVAVAAFLGEEPEKAAP